MSKNSMLMEHFNIVQSSLQSFIQSLDIKNGHYAPLVYILLPHKTETCYTDMLLVKSLLKCTTEQGLVFNPDRVTLNFEVAS